MHRASAPITQQTQAKEGTAPLPPQLPSRPRPGQEPDDPESALLVRQLHRELNGFRSRRGAAAINDKDSNKDKSKSKPARQQETGSKEKGSRRKGESAEESDSDSGSEKRPSKKGKKEQGPAASIDKQTKPAPVVKAAAHKEASHKVAAAEEDQPVKHVPQGEARKPDKIARNPSKVQDPAKVAPNVAAPPAGKLAEAAGCVPDTAAAAVAAAAVAAAADKQPAATQAPKSEFDAAAAAASVSVKHRVKSHAGDDKPASGERLIKCFHAGVRWGITLPAEALKTRGDLATALNDAFAGEILSCGRGDTLSIAFLDAEGTSTEFPSLRSSGVKESASKWKGQVDKAVKIYVRRS